MKQTNRLDDRVCRGNHIYRLYAILIMEEFYNKKTTYLSKNGL
jgi:hypothetical protein